MPKKFEGSGESRFGGSEKDLYFLKIAKWQHELVPRYKRGKLVSYFLNDAAKTCSYELKVSENIEINHAFQCKVFFISVTQVSISIQVASKPLSLFHSKTSWKDTIISVLILGAKSLLVAFQSVLMAT